MPESALFYRLVISFRGSGIHLARSADSHVRIRDHFLPMRNPDERYGRSSPSP